MNLTKAIEEHARREIEDAEADARRALSEYVAAQQRLMRLRAIEHLSVAMGEADAPPAAEAPVKLERAS